MAASDLNTVADFFISTAHECGDLITNLKLQKLAYYAQAWHLAVYNQPLVDEDFQAWVHGPVAPKLYDRFKKYRWNPIDEEIAHPDVTGTAREILEEVQDEYGGFSAYDLERMTHAEEPWIQARAGLAADVPSDAIIDRNVMKRYYAARMAND